MEWKSILDYWGLYEVSENGDIRRIAKTNNQYKIGHILKWNIINGYAHVQLHKNGKVKSMRVHRLVALSFIPNIHNKPHVNHIDGDKLNNHYSNLEWCTASENELHKHHVLGKTKRIYNVSKDTINTWIQMRKSGVRLIELETLYNIPLASIHRILSNNKIKTGYSGMFNGRSKLKDYQRTDIINIYNQGKTKKEIAKDFNVTYATINRIIKKNNEKTH